MQYFFLKAQCESEKANQEDRLSVCDEERESLTQKNLKVAEKQSKLDDAEARISQLDGEVEVYKAENNQLNMKLAQVEGELATLRSRERLDAVKINRESMLKALLPLAPTDGKLCLAQVWFYHKLNVEKGQRLCLQVEC